MRDSTKIVLLGVIALVFAFFVYRHWLERRQLPVLSFATRTQSVGDCISWRGDCSVIYGVSNHYA